MFCCLRNINCIILYNNYYSDMEKIQAGLGEKLGLFLQYMTTFVAGYIIAFIADWRLALVMSTLLPVLAIIAGTNARVSYV